MQQKSVTLDYITQYSEAVNHIGWLADLQLYGNGYNMKDLSGTFNLDLAKGYQLDLIGKLVGYPRPVRFTEDALQWNQGFFDNANWGGNTSALVYVDDETYRKILRVWCGQLTEPTTLNNIYKILVDIFGDVGFEVVAGNKIITVKIPNSLSANDKSIILSGIIVPPQTVTIQYQILP